jgi:hypothetical protein
MTGLNPTQCNPFKGLAFYWCVLRQYTDCVYPVSRQFTLTQHIIPAQSQQQRQLSTADPCSTMPTQFNSTVLLTDSYTATRVIKNGMSASLPF